ncbi:hypothetical protein WKW50_16430 [Ochrobactrum sp. GPK 3]
MRVACVLKSGGAYDAEYVGRLHLSIVSRHPEVEFFCISDVPVPCQRIEMGYGWPGWWSKMELFRPDIKGDLLTIDLDTVVCGDISDILAVDGLTMLRDFYHPSRSASGLMVLPERWRRHVWKSWMWSPWVYIEQYSRHGDQAYLADVFRGADQKWQDLVPNQIVSYKCHVAQASSRNPQEVGDGTIPPDARMICFHGTPRPRDVRWLETHI